MLASITEVSVHIVTETSRCTTDTPNMENVQTCVCQLLNSEGLSDTTFDCEN